MTNLNLKPSNVLLRPRVTEKAALGADKFNVYTFEVVKHATKKMISASIRSIYRVSPEKIRVLPRPAKKVFIRGKWGVKSGGKKAYVYLKKGDKIEII